MTDVPLYQKLSTPEKFLIAQRTKPSQALSVLDEDEDKA